MKIKTIDRAFGAFQLTLCGGLEYLGYQNILRGYNSIVENNPAYEQIILSGCAVGAFVSMAVLGIPVIDGITDLVKGTHHYFFGRLIQRFTKDPKRKRELNETLENQLKIIEEPIPSFNRKGVMIKQK